jgi:hypothetical protein
MYRIKGRVAGMGKSEPYASAGYSLWKPGNRSKIQQITPSLIRWSASSQ